MKLPLTALVALLLPLSAAWASPGPPPPDYIDAMAKLLAADQTAATLDRYTGLLASDLRVFVDGKEVAANKAAWLAIERHRLGKVDRRVVAVAEGDDTILVVDLYDDRSGLPGDPRLYFDSRYLTRAVQYRVGADHLVHAISILQSGSYLRAGDRQ